MSKEVDIIVIYWSSDFMIKKCINQLLKTDYGNYKITIVDNTRKSKKELCSYFDSDKVEVIDGVKALINGKKRSGFKRGRHHPEGIDLGIRKTSSKYVALFHPDSWPIDDQWLNKSMEYLEISNVKMVGIQHETSIHTCFQFFKRSTISNLGYLYSGRKKPFGKNRCVLNSFIKHPDDVMPARVKWDWGESLSINLYKRGFYTVGLNPTKGYAPYLNDDYLECDWRDFAQGGFGCIYGDMIFHIWKTFRKKEKILKYKKEYFDEDYMKKYYCANSESEKIVFNKDVHDNSIYKKSKIFKYCGI